MTRLPTPGSDSGIWGQLLNEFLTVEHNADGSLKASGSLASKADDSSVVHLTGSQTIAGAKTFTVSPIVPTPTSSTDAANKTYVDTAAASGTPDATGSTKGKIQLAGDLGGTAAAPTVPNAVKKGEIIFNAKDYGAVGDGVANDTAALQSAITAAAGRPLLIPKGTYNHTTLTISADNTRLILDPGAVLNHTTWNETAISVTGARCSITGGGSITSPATWDGTNVTWTYAVILVTGNNFTLRDIVLDNVPKVGVGLRNVNDVLISGCRIFGNFPPGSWTGTQTVHFGITYDPPGTSPDGDVVITGNIIRTCVQGIDIGNFGSGIGYNINISTNAFEGCFNHGIYLGNGVGAVIGNNTFNRCQQPIVIFGPNHVVTGNMIETDGTGGNNDQVGISARESQRCIITNNTLYGETAANSVGIALDNLTGDPAPNTIIRDNIVANNQITTTNGGTATAIRVGNTTLTDTCENNIISGNLIKVPGRSFTGLIAVSTMAASPGRHNKVIDNMITVVNATYGIQVVNQTDCEVRRNTLKWEFDAGSSTTIYGISVEGSTQTSVTHNRLITTSSWGTNVNIRGIADQSASDYTFCAHNEFYFDTTKLASGTAIHALGTNSVKLGNRFSKTDASFTLGAVSLNTSTASPESVVTAGPGSLCMSTAGVLYKKSSGSGNTGWSAISGTSPDVQTFTASGTWTKPSGATVVQVELVGGGGGGGSGARRAAGVLATGGGGGGGAGIVNYTFLASDLPSSVSITVGTGGAGASAVTTDDTNGSTGTSGIATIFGAFARAYGGSGGGAGSNTGVGSGGSGNLGTSIGGTGAASSATGAAGTLASVAGGCCGGSSGGGVTTGNAAANGGAGQTTWANPAGATAGSAGVVDTTAPTDGGSVTAGLPLPGGSGGGGASSVTTNAQAGANGGNYGAGGSGGGASRNTSPGPGGNSGAGGNGAPGVARITTYF